MIIYNKTTKDEPLKIQIARYEKIHSRWVRQIQNYRIRQAAGTLDANKADKAIAFCRAKLSSVDEQIALLSRYAEED